MLTICPDNNTVRPFVILSSQRSGSTFVRIWLNSHSMIHSYGEVFLGHYEAADGFRAYCDSNAISRQLFRLSHTGLNRLLKGAMVPRRLVTGYLETLYCGRDHPAPWTDIDSRVNAGQAREPRPVIGFKVMYNTLAQYRALDDLLPEQCLRVIHITRNNLLRQYTSVVRMGITRIAHSKDPGLATSKIHIDADSFVRFARTQTEFVRRYRDRLSGRMPYLEFSYEEFFANTGRIKGAILELLELEDEEMPFHRMRKIGSSRLCDDIENWDEICRRLGRTPYAAFLEDSG